MEEVIQFTHYLQWSPELVLSVQHLRNRLCVANIEPILASGHQNECVSKLQKRLGSIVNVPAAMTLAKERARAKRNPAQHTTDVEPEEIAHEHPC